jgi:hypothetical protein
MTPETRCVLCDELILEGGVLSQRVAYQIVGFEFPRKQGGTNMIRLRSRTGNVAHQVCVERARGVRGQESLFEDRA